MAKFRSDLLLRLARKLESLKPRQFDYNRWSAPNHKEDDRYSCGSVGCALGWAVTIPSIAKAGLFMLGHWPASQRKDRDPALGAVAACSVFGISQGEACALFLPQDSGLPNAEYATPKQVAKHIRRFVSDKKKELGLR